ncbi:MAG: hypothetical protein P1V97_12700 [Planctomycetota bacterium]|nr:hypothetical protein [Planctomycetota bacterium]
MKFVKSGRSAFLIALSAALLCLSSSSQAGTYDKALEKKVRAGIAGAASLGPDAYWRDPAIKKAVSAIQEFGKTDNPKAATALIKMGLVKMKFPSAEVAVFNAVREALKGMKDKDARAAVLKTLKKKKDWRVQVTLIDVLASYKDSDDAEFLLHEMLNAKKAKERIVAEIAATMAKRKDKRSVRPLIKAFGVWKKRGGVTFKAIEDALYEITGKSFNEQADWDNFWDPRETTFNPMNAPKAPRGSTVLRKRPRLFGSEVISKKVVIIIDVSGSMHIRDPGEDKDDDPVDAGLKGSTARKTPKKRPAGSPPRPGDPNYKPGPCRLPKCPKPNSHDGNLPAHRMRIERAKRQLAKLVNAFDKNTKFNLVQFSTTASAWKPKKIMPATSSNKSNAVGYIKNLNPSGVTLAYQALITAFQCKEADTIYFISDGSPTNVEGKNLSGIDLTNLIDKVRQLNKFRKVKVHTIGLKGCSTSFMRQLAALTNGKFRLVD